MSVQTVLMTLESRLPELEWQLKKHRKMFSPSHLPYGLFRNAPSALLSDYVHEIREDIQFLQRRTDENHVLPYLALKLQQKINVLVTLCSRYMASITNPQPEVNSIPTLLQTRQARLHSLDELMNQLQAQKEALIRAGNENNRAYPEVQLKLNHELGEVEKQLSLLQETYHTTLKGNMRR